MTQRIPSLVTIGETMGLLTSPSPGPLRHQTHLALSVGGAESNVAIGVARLGISSTWISRLGADAVGELVERELSAEHVRVIACRDTSRPTGLMIKNRHSATHTEVLYYRSTSAAAALTPDDIDASVLDGATYVHLSGITPALSESCRGTVDHILALARDRDIPVSFDINYRSALWDRQTAVRVLEPMLADADIVFAGRDEAHMFTGARELSETCDALSALARGYAVIKLGEAGAAASVGGVLHRQDPHPVDAIDSVGAGDAFVAGYLAHTMTGHTVPESLAAAAVCGALACTVPGDWQGAPSTTDLARALSPHGDPVLR
ncbi:sugar kinase [Mycobacterium sp. DL99]|uniref:sugar kinase n=1 Tax=Mycobacterium sp. DL99 TaxID=2528957 RepID=UPI001081C63B|nr:sugar kinase [Mycobacterium sp. DL99]